jgi:hypothetical protein
MSLDGQTADAVTMRALLNRLNEQGLPHLFAIQRKVDRGEAIDEMDIGLLQKVLNDAGDVSRLADRNPQILSIVARVAQLYNDISGKALENEQQSAVQRRAPGKTRRNRYRSTSRRSSRRVRNTKSA